MPNLDITIPGAPVWMELATSDVDASIAFYEALFGWTHTVSGSDANAYVNFFLNNRHVAGLMAKDPSTGMPDAWLTYLLTDDANDTARRVPASGGQLYFNDEAGDNGVMVISSDPSGAPIAAWQKGTHRGFGVVNEANAPVWHELHTSAYAATVPFYQHVFDWTLQELSNTDEFRMVVFAPAGQDPVAGIYDSSTAHDDLDAQGSHWLNYIGVGNADAAAERITELGGRMLESVTDSAYGRNARAVDVTGAPFAISEVR
ncbi:VOC family protein [Glaciihabitans sp. dw_435]|uniref:VOC family protein n=1 Tax=Glaciihabitans sp. dw_435 TaxID=2720081 RepID=UPI001BD694B0|nr:VOC family protein [Glaciihabitans sp. dw_435]